LRRESLEVVRPLQAHVDRRDDEVQRAGQFLKLGRVLRIDSLVGAEFFHLRLLGIRRREGKNFAAPLVHELKGQMAKAANADDANAVGGLDVELNKRIENRGAGAKERPSLGGLHAFGDRKSPHGLTTDPLGETAMAMNDGLLDVPAKIVIPRK